MVQSGIATADRFVNTQSLFGRKRSVGPVRAQREKATDSFFIHEKGKGACGPLKVQKKPANITVAGF